MRMPVLMLFTLLILAGVACHGRPDVIGVERGTDGTLVIHAARCGPEAHVTRVAFTDGARYEPDWEIVSTVPHGATIFKFELGAAVQGFDVSIPSDVELKESGNYMVIVDSSVQDDVALNFDYSEAKEALVLIGRGKYVSVSDFEAGVTCP